MDTIDIDFGVDEVEVQEASVRFILDNGLPINYNLDVIFLDSLSNPLVSIIDQVNIEGADVDANGYVIGNNRSRIDIPLDQEQISQVLGSATKVVLSSSLETTGAVQGQNVRIGPSNRVKTIIGVKVGVNVDLNNELGITD